MAEVNLYGLNSILHTGGTLHGIEAPSERQPAETHEQFVQRYDEWYWRVHTWKTAWKAAGRE